MSDCCQDQPVFTGASAAYRRALWAVIALNATMFVVEVVAGFAAQSMALRADALDFLADSATYAVSLWVISKPPAWRARAALGKGLSLAAMGLWVLSTTVWRVFVTGVPEPLVMGAVGTIAFGVNVASVVLLLRYRDGDANVRSVWLCSRNDAIGNIAVVLAASGVFASGTAWPDIAVAAVMASLFLAAAVRIVRQSLAEMADADAAASAPNR